MSPAGRASQPWPCSDALCSITTQSLGGKPSLLDTLKAAAQQSAACPEREQLGQAPADAGGKDTAATQLSTRAGGGRCSLQPLQLKRPATRKSAGGTPASPTAASAAASAAATTRFVHRARAELARLEVEIPWEAVHESWRGCRAQWRKALKGAEALADVMAAMRALREALAIPGSPFASLGGAWDRLAARCCGVEEAGQLLGELRANARAWVRVRGQQAALPCSQEQQDMAMRGLEALWAAQARGPVALAQCPLEAVLDYDAHALEALRQLLAREISLQNAAAMSGGGAAAGPVAGSVFALLLERGQGSGQSEGPCCLGRPPGSTSSEMASDAGPEL